MRIVHNDTLDLTDQRAGYDLSAGIDVLGLEGITEHIKYSELILECLTLSVSIAYVFELLREKWVHVFPLPPWPLCRC